MKMRLFVIVASLALTAAPARANQLTLNFSGSLDLSSVGGLATNSYSGSVTWDPAAVAVSCGSLPLPGSRVCTYPLVSTTFVFNGKSETAASNVTIGLNINVLSQTGLDALELIARPGFNAGGAVTADYVILYLSAPHGLFGSTALPGDLSFLGSVQTRLVEFDVSTPSTSAQFLSTPTVAQGDTWVSHGPEGGAIRSIAVSPTTPATVFSVTSSGGVFMSSNAGANWTDIGGRFPYDTRARVVVIDPQTPTTLYVGAWTSIFKSTDNGFTWVNTGLHASNIGSIAVNPVSPTTIFAAGAAGTGSGVFRSTDAGGTWSALSSSPAAQVVAIDPLTTSTVYAAGSGTGIFRSSDGGGTWNLASTGLTNMFVNALLIDPVTPTTLYAGTNGGVFKSTDGASTWQVANTGLTQPFIQGLALDRTAPATLYAGTNAGLFKTTNGATSWTASSTGLPAGLNNFPSSVQAVAVNPLSPSTVYAGTISGGVFISTSAGASWTSDNVGLAAASVSALAIDPQAPATLYAGGDGVSKSADGGNSWGAASIGLPRSIGVRALAIDRSTSTTIYAGTTNGLFKSTDAGGSWSSANSGMPQNVAIGALALDPSTSTTLYAGTSVGIFKSVDGASSWSALNAFPSTNVLALAINPVISTTVYAGASAGRVWKSSDGGGTWNLSNTGLTTSGSVLSFAIDPLTPTTLYALDVGVNKSTDGGATWTAMNAGMNLFDFSTTLVIDPATPTTLYVGQETSQFFQGFVYTSTDGGHSWRAVTNPGLTDTQISALALGGGTLYAGTFGGGVFQTTVSSACTFALSPAGQSFTSQGGSGSITVTTSNACSWRATPPANWVFVSPMLCPGGGACQAPALHIGPGSLPFVVAPNPVGPARSTAITIGGQSFRIDQQAGVVCSFVVSPPSVSTGSSGGTARLVVNAPSACNWNAQSGASWIAVTAGGTGAGNGAVTLSISPSTGAARTGTVIVAGQPVTVTEAALGQPSTCGSAVEVTSKVSIYRSGLTDLGGNGTLEGQTVRITNVSGSTIVGPLYLVFQGLPTSAVIVNGSFLTTCFSSSGDATVLLPAVLLPQGQNTGYLPQFFRQQWWNSIVYTPRVLSGTPPPLR